MKCILMLFMVISSSCFAKRDSTSVDYRNEISLVVNSKSVYNLSNTICCAYEGGNHSDYTLVNLQGRYMNNVSRHIAIGGIAGFDNYHGKYDNCLYLNVAIRVYWFDRKHFGMYSLAGAGPAYCWGHEKKLTLSPNLIPIGMEGGGTKIRGFIELFGLGNVGLISSGLKLAF